MTYVALVSFSGVVSMAAGEVKEISDPSVAADLIKAGYVEEVKKNPEGKTTKKRPKGV